MDKLLQALWLESDLFQNKTAEKIYIPEKIEVSDPFRNLEIITWRPVVIINLTCESVIVDLPDFSILMSNGHQVVVLRDL